VRSRGSGLIVGFAVLAAVLLGLSMVRPGAELPLWLAAGAALVVAWVLAVRRNRGIRRD
jgi:hypothetical protein